MEGKENRIVNAYVSSATIYREREKEGGISGVSCQWCQLQARRGDIFGVVPVFWL